MKKALQTSRLRAPRSLPDRTAGSRSRKACGGRSRDPLAELRVLDRSGERGGLEPVPLGGLDGTLPRQPFRLVFGLGEGSRREADRRDAEALRDLLRALLELERPDGIGR